jgi:hypothetical protein
MAQADRMSPPKRGGRKAAQQALLSCMSKED